MSAASATIPHGTLSGSKGYGCRCLPCSNAAAAYQTKRYRQIGYGTWCPLVDAAPARRHVESLHAQGMTWERISAASGVHLVQLRRLRAPHNGRRTERIRPERAKALLAVELDLSPARPQALVPAVGTVRRLQALRAIGWPVYVLADRSGVSRHALTMAFRRPTVQDTTRVAVVELFDDLHDQDPRRHGVAEEPVRRAIAAAARRGWAAPNCWLDGDIDDPAAKPGPPKGRRYAHPSAGDRQQAVVEDTAELAQQGLNREAIARRLGMTWGAVHRTHLRAGVPVPAVLNAA